LLARKRLEFKSVQHSRRVYRLMYVICDSGRSASREPGLICVSEQLRILSRRACLLRCGGRWCTMSRCITPAPPSFTVRHTLDMILDSIKKRSWACHSHPARPPADGKHLNHITPWSMAGRYSLSLGLFVHVRIRFHSICSFLFAASSTNGRPGGLYGGLSSAPPSPPQAKSW
jgi:hypothetical protein